MGIGTALMLGFGILIFVAASSVLGIGLWSARENTIELLRDREEYLVDLLVERVRGHLDPVMKANAYLADLINKGVVDPTNEDELISYMRGAMAATPQVVGMAFVTPDMRMLRYQRASGRIVRTKLPTHAGSRNIERMEQAKAAARPYWGDLIWSDPIRSTILNRRSPIRRNGQFMGMLISAITLADLSQFLKDADKESKKQRSFLLYGSDYVLAHPSMADGDYPRSARQPIPAIEQMDDPVLRNIWNASLRGKVW